MRMDLLANINWLGYHGASKECMGGSHRHKNLLLVVYITKKKQPTRISLTKTGGQTS